MLLHDMMMAQEFEERDLVGYVNIGSWSVSKSGVFLPSGRKKDDLVFYFALSGGNAGSIATPSGFTLINNEISTAGLDSVSHVSYKKLNGSETSYNLTEGTNGSVYSSAFVLIRGYSGLATGININSFQDNKVVSTTSVSSGVAENMTNTGAGFTLKKNDAFLFVGLSMDLSWSSVSTTYDKIYFPYEFSGNKVAFYRNRSNNGDGTTLLATTTVGPGTCYYYEIYLRCDCC